MRKKYKVLNRMAKKGDTVRVRTKGGRTNIPVRYQSRLGTVLAKKTNRQTKQQYCEVQFDNRKNALEIDVSNLEVITEG